MKKWFLLGALVVPLTLSASPMPVQSAEKPAASAAVDPHSYANIDQVRVKHINLELDVLFGNKQLSGYAELQLDKIDPGVSQLVLDTRDLVIEHVLQWRDGEWQNTAFQLDKRDPVFGSRLRIDLATESDRVRVYYHSTEKASGLQWLSPAQTAGKKARFLFSQSQAIHARSWIPLQDTPAVRQTYRAHIRTPDTVMAVMSADNSANSERDGDYHFEMPQPIASYLIALAVGDLSYQRLSPQMGIYAEPATLASAVAEFDDTQQMITAAERLFGAYRWGQYDLLILPPSFPYGGMENPRLSFITPTVIAGDKSLVSMIAHELAHSWSGNLVTNSNWQDSWLNEGFTSYVENRIVEEVYGAPRALMERALVKQWLDGSLEELDPKVTPLHPAESPADPDDMPSAIIYAKGQMMLHYLEAKFGRAVFDEFLTRYFDHFAFRTVDTKAFVAFLDAQLLKKHPGKVSLDKIKAWVYQPGLPADAPKPTSEAFELVDRASAAWQQQGTPLASDNWNAQQWLHFIDNLPRTLSHQQLAALDKQYGFSRGGNTEIALSWFKLTIALEYWAEDEALVRHLSGIGRVRLIKPLYKALMATEHGRQLARQTYARARDGYHPYAQTVLDRIIKP